MTAAARLEAPRPAKLSVADYMLLDRSGAFREYNKTELIDGTIYIVNSQYSRHMKAKVRLLRRLADACDALGGGLQAWSEGAVEMQPSSMPEPDVFITRQEPEDGPVPMETVALVAEVADATVKFDLGRKARLYARQGIPEYWVVDLPARIVHQMWAPAHGAYGQTHQVAFGQALESQTIAGLGVSTEGL